MKFSKVLFITTIMSFAVFAQDDYEENSSSINSSNSGSSFGYSPAPSVAPSSSSYSSYSSAPAVSDKKSNVNLRFEGDIYLEPGFEFENEYYFREENNLRKRYDTKSSAFNIQYGWNARFGLDFGDNFSTNFRLSNPEGYGLGQLSFANGSAKGYVPTLPNAYFTWKPGVFSLSGGLLEVSGNTVLDLVAGVELAKANGFEDCGLWTWYWGWDAEYNASQGGLKFSFDFSDNFAFNLTAALVNPNNTLGYDAIDIDAAIDDGELVYEYVRRPNSQIRNEFRFIFDANISLGDIFTISPVFQTRSFWREYHDPVNKKYKTSILVAYGLDVGLDFSDAFNLGVGFAMGNLRLNKSYYVDGIDMGNDESASGFIIKAAPSLSFGINDLSFVYSLGSGTFKSGGNKYSTTCNDLHFDWLFNVSENFGFGPTFSMALESIRAKINTDNGSTNEKVGGYNWTRYGLQFVASF